MNNLKFEVGKCYRTRDGRKATVLLIRPGYTVLLIRPGYMTGEIEGFDATRGPFVWTTGGSFYRETIPSDLDLVAEWREPVRLRVVLTEKRMGNAKRLQVFREDEFEASGPGMYEVIDTFELVEGEGDR